MGAIERYLTGITTTGTPHLGNYVGAIRPAVQASRRPGTENFYFLADYHALIKCDEPARIQRSTLEIAACWLAVTAKFACSFTWARTSSVGSINVSNGRNMFRNCRRSIFPGKASLGC